MKHRCSRCPWHVCCPWAGCSASSGLQGSPLPISMCRAPTPAAESSPRLAGSRVCGGERVLSLAPRFWMGIALLPPPPVPLPHQWSTSKRQSARERCPAWGGSRGSDQAGSRQLQKVPLHFQAVILAHPHGPQEHSDLALVLGTLEIKYLSPDCTAALRHCSWWVCL